MLEVALQEFPRAAFILEPVLYEQAPTGYLESLPALCRKYGTVLIFDENVTGFRWANGGAQEYFGVIPDLAVFGKAMANGFPLAAIVGPQDLMQHATVVSGTFGGEIVSLGACQAVLEVYQKEPVIQHMWEIGGKLRDGLRAILSQPFSVDGYPCKPRIQCEDRILYSLFLQEMAMEGVLLHPGGLNVMYAHTPKDVAQTIVAANRVMRRVREAMDGNQVEAALQGKPFEDVFRATGHRQ